MTTSDAKKLLERWESGEMNAAQFMEQAPEAIRGLLGEVEAGRALLDPEVSFKDLEVHLRDGSLKTRISMSEGSQPYAKFLASMMWHVLMGEKGDESADGTEPENYRACEVSYQGMRCSMEVIKPNGKTPHQLRERAEKDRDAWRKRAESAEAELSAARVERDTAQAALGAVRNEPHRDIRSGMTAVEYGRWLMEQVVEHDDANGDIANHYGDELRDALRAACDELRTTRPALAVAVSERDEALAARDAAVTQLEEARRANDLNAANLAGFHAALAVAVSERDEARAELERITSTFVLVDGDELAVAVSERDSALAVLRQIETRITPPAWQDAKHPLARYIAAALSQLPTQQEAEQ